MGPRGRQAVLGEVVVMVGIIIDLWRRLRITTPRFHHIRYYPTQADLPRSIDRQSIAVVGSADAPKWGVFECPCGLGHRIMVNLSRIRHPVWTVRVDRYGISVVPSIDAIDSRCHYWIRRGRVEWVPA